MGLSVTPRGNLTKKVVDIIIFFVNRTRSRTVRIEKLRTRERKWNERREVIIV